MENTGNLFLKIVVTVLFLLTLILFPIASFTIKELPNYVEDIVVEYSFTARDSKLSSLKLNDIGENWLPLDNQKQFIDKPFAYLGIRLTNKSNENKVFILYNQSENSYTELLKPSPNGGITIAQHGENSVLSKSPISHYKAAFLVMVPANQTRDYILEYKSSDKIIIEPKITPNDKWIFSIIYERELAVAICSFFLFFLGFLLVTGLFLKNPLYLTIAFFCFSLFLSFLTQSQLLKLLIDMVKYPDWMFSFTVILNLISGSIFTLNILQSYMQFWQKKSIQTLIFIDFFCIGIAFVIHSSVIIFILKTLIFVTFAIFIPSLLKAFKEKNKFVTSIFIVFLPWIGIMIFTFFASFLGFSQSFLQKFYEAFILLTLFVLLVIILQYESRSKMLQKIEEMEQKEHKRIIETAQSLDRVSRIRHSVLDSIAKTLVIHLDAIEVNLNNFTEKDSYLVQSIETETDEIRKLIEDKIIKTTSKKVPQITNDCDTVSISPTKNTQSKNTRPERIYILNSNWVDAERIAILLRSENFNVIVTSDRFKILTDVAENLVSILIVATDENKELVFSLCRMLREKFNPLALPILMLTDSFAHSTMKKGFAAGVNDFLIHNYESAELLSRIWSLVKLREIYFLNSDLINSEKAKNTFLYFLTHNINTPLTLLLNHIRELENMDGTKDYKDLIQDMDVSAREINETVQNVLVSFRLSDGRQTLRFEEVFVTDVVLQIQFELIRKAKLKHQTMTISMNDSIKPLWADRYAVRGCIYNLVDNAIKFTPSNGNIGIFVYEKENFLFIEIKDSGPGIAEDEKTKLFERFGRLSSRPTGGESSIGLGLYIVHELAQMNNGTLSYQTNLDNSNFTGACFTLKFKYAETKHERL